MEETRQRPIRANRGEKLKRYLEEEELISSFKRKKLKTQEGSDSNGDIGDDKHNENELEENTTIRSVEGKKEQEQEQEEEGEEGEAEDETYQDNDDDKSNNKDDDEEDEEVRCLPCGATTENYEESEDTLGDMVQCDNCKTWQHAKCMGYKTKKSIPEVHKCDVCTGKPVTPIRQKGKPKKKEEPIEDTGIAGLKDKIRISTAKAFYNYFKKRFTNRAEGELKALDSLSDEQRDEKANAFAIEIEKLIFEEFKGPAYTTEGRRILFVLKKHFMNEIVEGTVSFKDVLHKTPQEINEDIAKVEQQNRENIKNIILTENDTSQIIRRTHKGDVIKENEFVQSSFIDESIAARKVDHRKFSDDVLYPGRIISHTANESNSYQNLNPRIVDDDSDSDHDGDGDGENKASVSENVPDREKSKSTESLSDIETAKQNSGNANEDDDEDDILPFLSGGEDSFDNTVVEKQHVWSGRITFPDFATFNALGEFYSCTDEPLKEKDMITNVSKELLNLPEYIVHGKLDRTVADDYLTKVVNSRDLYIIEISNDDKIGDKQYLKLYEYLLHKNKVGVLRIKLKFVKDSYLMPIDFRDEKLPSYLKAYKKDLRIGLYAVFVVQRNYIPHGSVKDTEYKPIEHIPIVPKYPSIEKPHPKTQLQHQPPYQYPQENQANRSGDQPVNTNLADILKLLN